MQVTCIDVCISPIALKRLQQVIDRWPSVDCLFFPSSFLFFFPFRFSIHIRAIYRYTSLTVAILILPALLLNRENYCSINPILCSRHRCLTDFYSFIQA